MSRPPLLFRNRIFSGQDEAEETEGDHRRVDEGHPPFDTFLRPADLPSPGHPTSVVLHHNAVLSPHQLAPLHRRGEEESRSRGQRDGGL